MKCRHCLVIYKVIDLCVTETTFPHTIPYSIHESEEVHLKLLDEQYELDELGITDRNANLVSIRYDVPLAKWLIL